jgi:hypothetical protein
MAGRPCEPIREFGGDSVEPDVEVASTRAAKVADATRLIRGM